MRDAWINEGVDRVCDLIVSMIDAAAELAADKTDVARLEAEVLALRLRLERIEAGGAVPAAPATSTLHAWEEIGSDVYRYAVPGGWLYYTEMGGPVFVPDPDAPGPSK
jgi:hypothetical protein